MKSQKSFFIGRKHYDIVSKTTISKKKSFDDGDDHFPNEPIEYFDETDEAEAGKESQSSSDGCDFVAEADSSIADDFGESRSVEIDL